MLVLLRSSLVAFGVQTSKTDAGVIMLFGAYPPETHDLFALPW